MMEKMSKIMEVTIVMNKNRAQQYRFGLDEIGHYLSRANIADHINEIDKILADGGSIVLYSEKQLEDLRSMCCTGQSILGIDKTFNLCDMHVTALPKLFLRLIQLLTDLYWLQKVKFSNDGKNE
jgi:hypothetical protein